MRVRAAQHRSVQHAGQREIGGIKCRTQHLVACIRPVTDICHCVRGGMQGFDAAVRMGNTGHRIQHAHVAGAAAKISPERPGNLRLRGIRIAVEQRFGSHDGSRRAETTLHGAGCDEGFLQRVQVLRRAQSLDRDNLLVGHTVGANATGSCHRTVHSDHAGPAGAIFATLFGAGKAKLLA